MPLALETQPHTTAGEGWVSPFPGEPVPREILIDLSCAEKEYFEHKPDARDCNQLVSWPSGTEKIHKIYAETFKSASHLNGIVSEAEKIVNDSPGGLSHEQ
jgi:hypothetical protein